MFERKGYAEEADRAGQTSVDELDIAAEEENLGRVLEFVEDKLAAAECPPVTQMQIAIAVEEIFVNIALYAYAPDKGRAVMRVEMADEPGSVTITFTDHGRPYDPLAAEDPDITLPAEEREVGGLGVYMVKQYMDEVEYEYRDGSNILTLKKNL